MDLSFQPQYFLYMHRNFLKQNKISITKLTQLHKIPVHSPRNVKQNWNLAQKQETEDISKPQKFPIHRRKKIFDTIPQPSLRKNQQANTKPLESAVRHYQLPGQPEVIDTCEKFKKLPKTIKQNVLCLVKGVGYSPRKQVCRKNPTNACQNTQQLSLQKDKLYQQYLKMENQRQKRVQNLENHNNLLRQQINDNHIHKQKDQKSLIVQEASNNAFVFQSKQSSLNYSLSKYIPQNYQVHSFCPNLQKTSPLQITN